MIEYLDIPEEWETILEEENNIGKAGILVKKEKNKYSVVYIWDAKEGKSDVSVYKDVEKEKIDSAVDQNSFNVNVMNKDPYYHFRGKKEQVFESTRNFLKKEGRFRQDRFKWSNMF